MNEWMFGYFSAMWLGILTSISPCPLATNIVAISYIGRRVDNPRMALWTGLFYTAGRMLTYLILGVLLVSSLLSIPYLSFWLQKYMNQFLGPILILVGMFLLELLSLNTGKHPFGEGIQKRVETWGLWGAGALGFVFALSFCPVSAALFFGSLIPLAIQYESKILLPSLYGVGTALPVFGFAVLIALGAHSLSRVFNWVTRAEWWARRITGGIFIVVGIYYSLVYVFRVQFY